MWIEFLEGSGLYFLINNMDSETANIMKTYEIVELSKKIYTSGNVDIREQWGVCLVFKKGNERFVMDTLEFGARWDFVNYLTTENRENISFYNEFKSLFDRKESSIFLDNFLFDVLDGIFMLQLEEDVAA